MYELMTALFVCFCVDGYYGFMLMLLKFLDIDIVVCLESIDYGLWLITIFQKVSLIFKGNSVQIFMFSLCICLGGVLKLKLNLSLIF